LAPGVIGPFDSTRELRSKGSTYSVPLSWLNVPDQGGLDLLAEACGVALGIEFQAPEPRGAFFVLPTTGGGRRELEREDFYALVPVDEVLEAPAAFVRFLHARYGAGRAWTLAGRVGFVSADGGITAVNVAGERHLLMRMFVVHDNGPERVRPGATPGREVREVSATYATEPEESPREQGDPGS
jgi:hypothetical protein